MFSWYWVREKLFCLKSFKCSSFFFFFGKISWLSLIVFSFIIGVRLNLINHFVGFISCQFACNSALRNPVFRWESCKGSVWKSVKKCSRMCTEAGTRDWISQVACDWQAARWCTWVKHVEKLNRHASCSTTRQKVQTSHSVSSRLGLATQSSL